MHGLAMFNKIILYCIRFNEWLSYVQSEEQIMRALARITSKVNEGNGRTDAVVKERRVVLGQEGMVPMETNMIMEEMMDDGLDV